jgi:hypothetical protein
VRRRSSSSLLNLFGSSAPPSAPRKPAFRCESSRRSSGDDSSTLSFLVRRKMSMGEESFDRRDGGGAVAPSLTRRSSLLDTKTVYSRRNIRSASFSEPSQFSFDAHFEWGEKLGSGSFADVFAVRHRARPDERYAVKVIRRAMRSKAERAEWLGEAMLANELPSQ